MPKITAAGTYIQGYELKSPFAGNGLTKISTVLHVKNVEKNITPTG